MIILKLLRLYKNFHLNNLGPKSKKSIINILRKIFKIDLFYTEIISIFQLFVNLANRIQTKSENTPKLESNSNRIRTILD
jgi:hypothetical protein